MKEQRRRIDPRVQPRTTTGGSQRLSVVARPVVPNLNVSNPGVQQTAQALDQFVGGVSSAINEYYSKQAEDDFAKGQQMAQTGEDAPDPNDIYLSSGYLQAKALERGLSHSRLLEEHAQTIDVADPETWNGYESAEDALDALIKSETASAIKGLPNQYAQTFLKPYAATREKLLNKKRDEFTEWRKDDLGNTIGSISRQAFGEVTDANPDSLRKIYDNLLNLATKDGIMNKTEARQVLAEQIGQYAIDTRQPEIIEGLLNAKDKDGISLGVTKIGDNLRRDLEAARRKADAEFNTGKISLMSAAKSQAAKGELFEENIPEYEAEIPGLFSNEQWANLLTQADRARLAKEKEAINTQMIHSGLGWMLPDGSDKNKMVDLAMEEISQMGSERGLDENQIFNQQVNVLSANGTTYKTFESIISNGAAVQGGKIGEPPPEGFLRSIATFERLKAVNPDVAWRHVSNKDAKENIIRYLSRMDANSTPEQAWAFVVQSKEQPFMNAKEYSLSGRRKELDGALSELDFDTIGSWFDTDFTDLKNPGAISRYFQDSASNYHRIGASLERALEFAKAETKKNWSVIGGRAVFTGGQSLPEDYPDFEEYLLKKEGYDPKEYHLIPSKMHRGVVDVMRNDEMWTNKSLNFSKEYEEFSTRNDPTLDDAKKGLIRRRKLVKRKTRAFFKNKKNLQKYQPPVP